MKVNSGQAASTLIPEYIGSAFDKIVTVADNIKQIKDIAASIEGLVGSGYIGDTPPTEPSAGTTWYCTLDGRSYIWYEDTDSGQWVDASPQSNNDDPTLASELQFPKNPIVGQEYDFAPYKYYWDGVKWKTKGIDLRDELEPRISDNESKVFEALKRSYADAGLNLVKGSFEEGGVLSAANDVMITSSGVGYSWGGSGFPHNVAPETNPTSDPLYRDRSDEVGGKGGSGGGDASIVTYTHAGVATAVQTTVANMMQSMRFNLTEFLSKDLTISQSIKNMLTAANGAGCYRQGNFLAIDNKSLLL